MRLLLLNLPVIDGVAAAVKLAERLVALSSGTSQSGPFAPTLAA
jgi:Asp/Glu/hydantoin racemase